MPQYQTIRTPQDYVNYTFNVSSRGITQVGSELAGLSNTVSTILGEIAFKTSEFLSHTEVMAMGMAAIVSAAFVDATNKAIDFQQQVANIQAIGGAGINAGIVGDKAMEFSNRFGMNISDMTDGLEALARAGINTTSVMTQVLEEGVKLSKLEGMDFEKSMESLITTTNLLAPEGLDMNTPEYAEELKKMNQLIVSASETSPIDAEDIIMTLQHAGGYAAETDIDQMDLFATIAQLGSRGTRGEIAGTALRAFMSAGQKDTAQRALARIGLNVKDLWAPDGESMLSISEMKNVIDSAMEARGMSKQEKLEFYSDFVGYKQANQIMKIDTGEIEQYKENIQHAWDLGKKLDIILGTVRGTLNTIWQTLSNFMTRVGGKMLTIIGAILTPISAALTLFTKIPFSDTAVAGVMLFAGFKLGLDVINKIIPSVGGLMSSFDTGREYSKGILGYWERITDEIKDAGEVMRNITKPDKLVEIQRNRRGPSAADKESIEMTVVAAMFDSYVHQVGAKGGPYFKDMSGYAKTEIRNALINTPEFKKNMETYTQGVKKLTEQVIAAPMTFDEMNDLEYLGSIDKHIKAIYNVLMGFPYDYELGGDKESSESKYDSEPEDNRERNRNSHDNDNNNSNSGPEDNRERNRNSHNNNNNNNSNSGPEDNRERNRNSNNNNSNSRSEDSRREREEKDRRREERREQRDEHRRERRRREEENNSRQNVDNNTIYTNGRTTGFFEHGFIDYDQLYNYIDQNLHTYGSFLFNGPVGAMDMDTEDIVKSYKSVREYIMNQEIAFRDMIDSEEISKEARNLIRKSLTHKTNTHFVKGQAESANVSDILYNLETGMYREPRKEYYGIHVKQMKDIAAVLGLNPRDIPELYSSKNYKDIDRQAVMSKLSEEYQKQITKNPELEDKIAKVALDYWKRNVSGKDKETRVFPRLTMLQSDTIDKLMNLSGAGTEAQMVDYFNKLDLQSNEMNKAINILFEDKQYLATMMEDRLISVLEAERRWANTLIELGIDPNAAYKGNVGDEGFHSHGAGGKSPSAIKNKDTNENIKANAQNIKKAVEDTVTTHEASKQANEKNIKTVNVEDYLSALQDIRKSLQGSITGLSRSKNPLTSTGENRAETILNLKENLNEVKKIIDDINNNSFNSKDTPLVYKFLMWQKGREFTKTKDETAQKELNDITSMFNQGIQFVQEEVANTEKEKAKTQNEIIKDAKEEVANIEKEKVKTQNKTINEKGNKVEAKIKEIQSKIEAKQDRINYLQESTKGVPALQIMRQGEISDLKNDIRDLENQIKDISFKEVTEKNTNNIINKIKQTNIIATAIKDSIEKNNKKVKEQEVKNNSLNNERKKSQKTKNNQKNKVSQDQSTLDEFKKIEENNKKITGSGQTTLDVFVQKTSKDKKEQDQIIKENTLRSRDRKLLDGTYEQQTAKNLDKLAKGESESKRKAKNDVIRDRINAGTIGGSAQKIINQRAKEEADKNRRNAHDRAVKDRINAGTIGAQAQVFFNQRAKEEAEKNKKNAEERKKRKRGLIETSDLPEKELLNLYLYSDKAKEDNIKASIEKNIPLYEIQKEKFEDIYGEGTFKTEEEKTILSKLLDSVVGIKDTVTGNKRKKTDTKETDYQKQARKVIAINEKLYNTGKSIFTYGAKHIQTDIYSGWDKKTKLKEGESEDDMRERVTQEISNTNNIWGETSQKLESTTQNLNTLIDALDSASSIFPPFAIAATALEQALQVSNGVITALTMAEKARIFIEKARLGLLNLEELAENKSLLGKIKYIVATKLMADAELAEAASKYVNRAATISSTIAEYALAAARLIASALTSGPVLAAIAIVVAAVTTLYLAEKQYAKTLKERQEAVEEAQKQQLASLATYKSIKQARENETDAIKKQQIAKKEAIALYQLEIDRMKRRKAVQEETETRNDGMWGEYGIRAQWQRFTHGHNLTSGEFKSQYENYDGTTKNIRQVKEETLGNLFATENQRMVAEFYDRNILAFGEIEAYSKELGELYDIESKLIEEYGSIDMARDSQEFADAVQDFCDATGIQADTAVKYLDWLETENRVNQATQAMQIEADMIVAEAQRNAMMAANPDFNGGEGFGDIEDAMIYAQADEIYQSAYDQLWWDWFGNTLWGYFNKLISIVDPLGIFGNWSEEADKHFKMAEAYDEGMQELVKTGTDGLYEQGEEAAKNAERRDYGTGTYTIDYGDTPFGAAKEASAASHADQQQMAYYENTGKVYTENEYIASQETYKSEKYPEPEEIVTEENINEVSEEESVKGADMYENADDMFEVQKQAAATAHDDAMAIVDAINNGGNKKDRIDTVTLASGAISGLGASAHKWQDEVVKEGAKRGTKRVISEVIDSGVSGTVAKGKTAINQMSESITPYMSKEGITRVVKGGKNAYSERGITGLFDYINEGTGSIIDSVDVSKAGTAEDSAGGFRRLLGASKNTANEFIEGMEPGVAKDVITSAKSGAGKVYESAKSGVSGIKNIYQAEGGRGVARYGFETAKDTARGAKSAVTNIVESKGAQSIINSAKMGAQTAYKGAQAGLAGAKSAYQADGVSGIVEYGIDAAKGAKDIASAGIDNMQPGTAKNILTSAKTGAKTAYEGVQAGLAGVKGVYQAGGLKGTVQYGVDNAKTIGQRGIEGAKAVGQRGIEGAKGAYQAGKAAYQVGGVRGVADLAKGGAKEAVKSGGKALGVRPETMSRAGSAAKEGIAAAKGATVKDMFGFGDDVFKGEGGVAKGLADSAKSTKEGIKGAASAAKATGGLKGAAQGAKSLAKVSAASKLLGPAAAAIGPAITFASSVAEHNPFQTNYNEDGSEKKAFQSTGEVLGETAGAVGAVAGGAEGALLGAAVGQALIPIPGVGAAIGGLVGGVGGGMISSAILEPLGEAIGGTVGWIGDTLFNGTMDAIGGAWDWMSNGAKGIWEGVQNAAGGVMDWLTGGEEGKESGNPINGALAWTPIGAGINAASGIWDWMTGKKDESKDPYKNADLSGNKNNINNQKNQSSSSITIKNININTEDDPEKIKSALMNLIIEMQEQVSPRQVSRTVGEPANATQDITEEENNETQTEGVDSEQTNGDEDANPT